MTKLVGASDTEANQQVQDARDAQGLFGDEEEAHEPAELIARLVRYATRRADPESVAVSLEERFRGLRGVLEARIEELSATDGVSVDAALLIRLVKELASEHLKRRIMGSDVIGSPADLRDYLTLALSGERVEKFLAIYLNSKNEALAIEVLHEGTINQTVVYPRKAIERAFSHKADSVIFVHNHPSGDPTPSKVDRELADTLERAAGSVGLKVLDHMIVGRSSHFSSTESGWT